MSYQYDLKNLGKEIGDTVRGAVKPEDVEHLKGSIDDIVKELTQVGRGFSPAPRYQQPTPAPKERFAPPSYHRGAIRVRPGTTGKDVAGVVLTILGSIFTLAAACIGLIFIGGMLTGIMPSVVTTILMLLLVSFGSLSGALLSLGSSFRGESKRYAQYLHLFQGQRIFPLKQLSTLTKKSKRYLAKDLQQMIAAGKFPNAHLDARYTNIILDEETYNQYLMAERKSQELAKIGKKATEPQPQPAPAPQATPADALIQEGRAYIERIHAADLAIQGEEVSRKIARLESTVSKIFDCVADRPEKQGDLRRLMNYYLPTTLKLLDAYQKFETHAVHGENVSTSMKEIEGALDTINLAFEKLLDDLFEHEMYDITSDISALETMLAQEGLTTRDFAATQEKSTTEEIGGAQQNG